MKRKRTIIASILLIVLVVSLGIFYVSQNQGEEVELGTTVGKRAPDLILSNLDGEEFALKDLRGKTVILDFFATWCPSCKAEMSHLNVIDSEYEDSSLEIISIGVDPSEGLDQLRKFKTNYEADWVFAKGVNAGSTYKISGIPTILIIDKNGIIQHRSGPITASSLRSKLKDVV